MRIIIFFVFIIFIVSIAFFVFLLLFDKFFVDKYIMINNLIICIEFVRIIRRFIILSSFFAFMIMSAIIVTTMTTIIMSIIMKFITSAIASAIVSAISCII